MKTSVVICESDGVVERSQFEGTLKKLVGEANKKITMIVPYFTYRGFLHILKGIPNNIVVDIVVSLSTQDQTFVDHKLLERCRALGCRIFGVKRSTRQDLHD